MQVIPGTAGNPFGQEIAELMGCDLLQPEYEIFPDGETYIRIPDIIREEVLIVQSCYYPQDSNFFQLLNLIHTIKDLADPKITVYVPYMCYARADRAVKSGEAVSINTVLNLLQVSGVDHLITLDLHNPKVLDRVEMKTTNVYPAHSIHEYLERMIGDLSHIQVVAPDQGAVDRAKKLASYLDVGFTALQKHRNPDTGNVSLKIGKAELNSAQIVIVDDIISTGGTLVEASNLLTINGVSKIHYIITHAIGTDAVDKLKEIGNGIVAATNSTKTIIGKISAAKDVVKVI